MEMLRGRGHVNSDSSNSDGETPISYPTGPVWGWEGILKLLRACGNIELDRRDEESRTPLSFLAVEQVQSVVKLIP